MLYSIVDERIEELYEEIVKGDLLVSLDSIKDFVYFIIGAEELQYKNKKEFSLSSFTRELSEELAELDDKVDLYDFIQEYDKVAYHYTNLNYGNQLEAKARAREEKEKGKQSRFEGKKLYGFHKDEFLDLMEIKSDSDHVYHKTYKRIVSEKGYLSRITFSEYKGFYEYLFDLINRDDPFSNIRYYKLEKRMNFELKKAILVAMKKNRQSKFKLRNDVVAEDLLMVTKIPLISERHRLVEIYSELDIFEDILKWRYIVDVSINRFINYAIQHVRFYLEKEKYNVLDNLDKDKFQSIYSPDTFFLDYKMRRDFNASDFKILMKYIDDNTKRKK